MPLPHVAVIIVNWNGREDTLACLRSLANLAYPAHTIVVTDNGSTDGSVAAIRAEFPVVTVIETGGNLGFVGGNNAGIAHAQTLNVDYALLLNNDTEVSPDFLSLLVATAEADAQAGIVGPTICYFDQPHVIWSAGGRINRHRGQTSMIGLDEVDRGQFGTDPRPVDFVTGCALLIKMSVIKEIGLLDPRFFAYYEETEWCVRAARAGFGVLHVPQAKLWHKISHEARETSPQVHYYMTRNRLLFLRLTQAGLSAWRHTLTEYARTLASWTLKPRWRHKAPQRRAMIQAITDYAKGHFGKIDVL